MAESKRRAQSPPCRDEREYRLRQRAKACVTHWVGVANERVIRTGTMPVPAVRFDLRGKTAGQWVSPRNHPKDRPTLVRINAELLWRYPEEMIQETVPHEVAHAVTTFIWGSGPRPHGREWQSVMQAFGKKPSRCHTMKAAPARQTSLFKYRCGCPDPHLIGLVRHRRAQSGKRGYRCNVCLQTIEYTHEPPTIVGPNDPDPFQSTG